METADPAGLLEEARNCLVEASRRMLPARAEDLDQAQGDLERAAKLLEGALVALAPGSSAAGRRVSRSLTGFERQLQTALALHEHAGAFYAGWSETLARLSGAAYAPGAIQTLSALAPPGRKVSLQA